MSRKDDDALFDVPASALTDAEQVIVGERELLTDRIRSDRAAAEALLHSDFEEFGTSGRRWTRAQMLATIGPLLEVPEVETLSCTQVAPGAILHVWRARRPDEVINRSSLWLKVGSRWQLRFHQGTKAI